MKEIEKEVIMLRKNLVAAQERNRQLDWMLTEAMEKLGEHT